MEKAENIDEFVRQIADLLSIGEEVSYDLSTLSYGELNRMNMDEYSEYLEMEDLPEDIDEELHDWEIDVVKYLREAMDLPNRLDPPRNREVFEWMADFANEQSVGGRFISAVQRALGSRHPFGAYKDVMYDYGLIEEWYHYRDECYRDYVRHELGLPRKRMP